jgi:iron(III) transport system permease protein
MSELSLRASLKRQFSFWEWLCVPFSMHILVPAAIFLLVVPPLVVVFLASLKPQIALPFDSAPLTLSNYEQLFSDPFFYTLAINTFLYAGCSLLIGLFLAVPIVWLVERTDMPGKNLISTAMFIPLIIPGMLTSFGWVVLLSPRTGVLNVWLRELMGMQGQGPLNIYSFFGLVFLTGISIVPGMFIMLSSLFRNMDPELEEAGAAAGGDTRTVLFRITLPLMTPGVVSVSIYYTIILIEMFEIPLVIGLNANFPVLSTYIFSLVFPENMAPSYALAGTFGTVAVLLGLGLAHIYERFTRAIYKFAVIRGRRSARRIVRLGKWKYLGLLLVSLYLIMKVLVPFVALLWSSLFPSLLVPSSSAFGAMTFGVYALVFQDQRLLRASANSLMLVLTVASVTMLLATLVSWIVVRSQNIWVRWLDAVAFLPRAIPGIVIALGILFILLRTPIYGTLWLLIIGHTVSYLPFGVRIMNASLMQLHAELEEASRTSGAETLTTFRRILLPLLRPALWNGWLWVVAHSVRDFTFPLMLGTSTNIVIAQLIWQYWQLGLVERAAAVSVLLIFLLTLVVFPARYYISRHQTF